MVTDRYQHEHHHPTVGDLVGWASTAGSGGDGIPLIGIDNLPGSVALETYDLPRECVLVFGQEGPGLTPQMTEACTVVLHVEQFGSTRSIDAGAARHRDARMGAPARLRARTSVDLSKPDRPVRHRGEVALERPGDGRTDA